MSNNHPIPMRGGSEYDALTRWKRYLRWRSKERTAIKRAYWHRARKALHAEMQLSVAEFWK